jgi:hypothetical protein
VQPFRRWVPGPVGTGASRADVPPMDGSAKDIAFCSELAFHGGVAVAEQGFKAEAELLRMRQAGLLEIRREESPPFAVTRVALSPKARDLLSRRGRTTAEGIRTGILDNAAAAPDPKQERILRRNGFEVARGMINAAVKSEIAAWKAAGGPGGYAALETRILTRISQIEVPIPA